MSTTSLDFSNPSDLPLSVRKLEPLSQVAYRHLINTGVEPDLDFQPIFQLALWGLDQGLEFQDPHLTSSLRQAVDSLLVAEDPNHALRYLTENPDEPEVPLLTSEQIQQAGSPLGASQLVLSALHLKLTADDNLIGVYPPIYPHSPG